MQENLNRCSQAKEALAKLSPALHQAAEGGEKEVAALAREYLAKAAGLSQKELASASEKKLVTLFEQALGRTLL
jgi:hypothetical protein